MKSLKKVIYFLTLAGIVLFFYLKWPELQTLLSLDYTTIILLLFISLIPILINAAYFYMAMKLFGYPLIFGESLGLTVINTMYSYMLPAKTGVAVRAYYLRLKHDFPYSSYLSFLAGNYIVGAIAALILVNFFTFYFWHKQQLPDHLFYSVLALLPFSILLIFLLEKIRIPEEKVKNKFLIFIKNSTSGIRTFKTNKKLFVYTFFAQLAILIVNALRLFITFHLLDFDVELSRVIMVQILLFFSMFVSITPGNLGIREGIIAFSAAFLFVSTDEALLVAIVDRAVLIISVFASGLFYTKTLLNDIKENGKS